MNSLYNEYEAECGPHVERLRELTNEFMQKVLEYADRHDLKLRETESVILNEITTSFAEQILINAKKLHEKSKFYINIDRAKKIAAELQAGDPEWEYKIEIENNLARIAVYNEKNDFVAYWRVE